METENVFLKQTSPYLSDQILQLWFQGGSCPTLTFIKGSGETKWEGYIHSCS